MYHNIIYVCAMDINSGDIYYYDYDHLHDAWRRRRKLQEKTIFRFTFRRCVTTGTRISTRKSAWIRELFQGYIII